MINKLKRSDNQPNIVNPNIRSQNTAKLEPIKHDPKMVQNQPKTPHRLHKSRILYYNSYNY